ncbi:MAG: hypothetical protein D6805_08270, partial [Planctomycetota bacterium]
MKSDLAKVLHRLGSKTLIEWTVGHLQEAGDFEIWVVVGHQGD